MTDDHVSILPFFEGGKRKLCGARATRGGGVTMNGGTES